MKKVKSYTITRTVVETYHVAAASIKEAKEIVSEFGDPYRVIVKSETVKINK